MICIVQQAKARLMDGRWDFDYVFFTESDQVLYVINGGIECSNAFVSILQILMIRIQEELFNHLKKYPRRLMVPHRLAPYPEEVILSVKCMHVYSNKLVIFVLR
jgi:hypothetical protein